MSPGAVVFSSGWWRSMSAIDVGDPIEVLVTMFFLLLLEAGVGAVPSVLHDFV